VIARTFNAEFIKSYIIEHGVFDEICEDDFTTSEWAPDMNSGWFLHKEGDDVLGIWMAELRNGITIEIHPTIPKKYRGKLAYQGANEFFAWICHNTNYQKINAEIATCFPNAKLFAMQCGMKVEGKIRQSFKKNGTIYDQWMLGMTRQELEARYE